MQGRTRGIGMMVIGVIAAAVAVALLPAVYESWLATIPTLLVLIGGTALLGAGFAGTVYP